VIGRIGEGNDNGGDALRSRSKEEALVRRDWPTALFCALLIAASVALFTTAQGIPVRPVDPVLGPRLFPLAITGGLGLLASLLLLRTVTGPAEPATDAAEGPLRWTGAALVLAGLLLFGLLVETAGYIVGAAAMFILVARAFGSRRLGYDIAIGLALAGAIFVVFTLGLGLKLPAGNLPQLLLRS